MTTIPTTPAFHDTVVDARPETDQQAAVAEAVDVLDARWPAWADSQHLVPRPVLHRGPVRVTLVGEGPDSLHHVAVAPFTFRHAGQEYQGFARGPASAPTFVVSRRVEVRPTPGSHRLARLRRSRGERG